MKEFLEKEGFIVTDAKGDDWSMHKVTKPVLIAGKDAPINKLTESVGDSTEYMIVRDYKSDKEYEFSLLIKEEGQYYFATDAGTFIEEVK